MLLIVAIVVAVVVRAFVLQTFYIPSESMEKTLLINDRVLVNKLIYNFRDPHRGEVIVFEAPANWRSGTADEDFIKRVIGTPGDHVVCCDTQQRITVNGVALDEPYIMNGKQGMPCYNGVYKVTVPQGDLWVLGDNREHSGDSSWNFLKKGGDAGFVPTKNVVGHVVGVVSWLRADHPAGS